ncbi:hypothetical protein OS175_10250 [Marinicella sp. S1101]|uniref:hypothetical protein n=1 Tax=Marinicella marina TaxID=2996016 RepID=UPI002260C26D|nr:hypothetical protein [Marinicella marina]MCX7554261.1 hypothetical protein [Marinicella marina]
MNKLQTRSLVFDVSERIQLWQWIESKELELVHLIGAGYKQSYQSDDIGHFANMLVSYGSFSNHAAALKAINKGLVS